MASSGLLVYNRNVVYGSEIERIEIREGDKFRRNKST